MDKFLPNQSSSQSQLSAPALPPPTPPASATSTSNRLIPEHLMYKNRLQEYAQRASLPLPIYQTICDGDPKNLKFGSTVVVAGKTYTSLNKFSHRKEAEQDVAKLALASITTEIKDEKCSLIDEDTIFCKSILNEYADKMQLAKPTYNTVKLERLLPVFQCSLVFNEKTYTGDIGRNKKGAEQFAARAAILSLLENEESREDVSRIINSKRKLYAASCKFNLQDAQHDNIVASKGIQTESPVVNNIVLSGVVAQAPSVMHPPHHEFTKTKPEPNFQGTVLPIAFVYPVVGQSLDVDPNSKKRRRKNKKKANKKMRTLTQ